MTGHARSLEADLERVANAWMRTAHARMLMLLVALTLGIPGNPIAAAAQQVAKVPRVGVPSEYPSRRPSWCA